MKTQKIKIENYSVLTLSNLLVELFNVNISNFKFESDIRGSKYIKMFFINNMLVAEIDVNKGNGFYLLTNKK